MEPFRTHTGEIVTGERLKNAFNKVADDFKNIAYAIRTEDAYASHVTEIQKEKHLEQMLKSAEMVRQGNITSFSAWQDINTELTGECVALLP
jgi:hypothetical protein